MNRIPAKYTVSSRHTLFRLTKWGLDLVSKKHVRLGRFFLLVHDGIPEIRKTRGPGEVRFGTAEEIEKLGLLNNRSDIFLSRQNAGDRCMVAVVGDRVVGYEWLCVGDQHCERRFLYRIDIPDGSMYCYNANIEPEYRISGIWLKFKNHIARVMKESGKNRLVTMIDYDNVMSINTHLRFGFRIFKCVTALRVFGLALSRETPVGEEEDAAAGGR